MKILLLGLALAVIGVHKVLSGSEMATAANEFLGTLTPSQRSQAVYPLDSVERSNWAYVPGLRKGISWGEMNPSQKLAAKKLLQGTLSSEGYFKVEAIRELETVLAEMEHGNLERDPNRYWFVFFGTPSESAPWVWRYEGHHVSLTFAYRDGLVVSSTPQFLGTNPAEVKSGPQVGKRVLAKEQDLGFRLAESLTLAQLEKAVLSKIAPADIVTAQSRVASIEGHLGLPWAEMTRSQQRTLSELISVHCEVQAKPEQKRRLKQVKDEGFSSIVFAWLGPIARGGRHYYRIQGKSFVIEYDNTQEDGNHIHTVWRDFKGDFGSDALAEHYAVDHHPHKN